MNTDGAKLISVQLITFDFTMVQKQYHSGQTGQAKL